MRIFKNYSLKRQFYKDLVITEKKLLKKSDEAKLNLQNITNRNIYKTVKSPYESEADYLDVISKYYEVKLRRENFERNHPFVSAGFLMKISLFLSLSLTSLTVASLIAIQIS